MAIPKTDPDKLLDLADWFEGAYPAHFPATLRTAKTIRNDLRRIAEDLNELAECRALLAMATAFDAGPVLPGTSYRWSTGPLREAEDSTRVIITRRDDGSWFVALENYEAYLHPAGDWVRLDPCVARPGFPSPAAALAALDAWRAARRVEIAGRDEAAHA